VRVALSARPRRWIPPRVRVDALASARAGRLSRPGGDLTEEALLASAAPDSVEPVRSHDL